MKIAVFSGTGDGRELCLCLAGHGHEVTAFAATEYGGSLMRDIRVHVGRLGADEMRDAIKGFDAVIDATHPYAAEATRNIAAACIAENMKYYRLVRNETVCANAVSVPDVKSAAEYLSHTSGRIFVSTGSKELSEFECIGERVTARVLDTSAVRSRCRDMRIAEILYKTPPFSYEDNTADFRGCAYLVTKDGGTAGGTAEKLRAAEELGMSVIMIERPADGKDGYTAEELKELFSDEDKDRQP